MHWNFDLRSALAPRRCGSAHSASFSIGLGSEASSHAACMIASIADAFGPSSRLVRKGLVQIHESAVALLLASVAGDGAVL